MLHMYVLSNLYMYCFEIDFLNNLLKISFYLLYQFILNLNKTYLLAFFL